MSAVDPALALGFAAACLQTSAYVLYVRHALAKDIEPNPTSWLMWAYGTGLFFLLELDLEAGLPVLLLPAACTLCSLAIALLLWRRGKLRWPTDAADRLALAVDLVVTVAYVAVLLAERGACFGGSRAGLLKACLLLCASSGTLASYLPTLRTTRADPRKELPLPWSLWTLAYAVLFLATGLEHGSSMAAAAFAVEPALCSVLSAMVALSARRPGPPGRSEPRAVPNRARRLALRAQRPGRRLHGRPRPGHAGTCHEADPRRTADALTRTSTASTRRRGSSSSRECATRSSTRTRRA